MSGTGDRPEALDPQPQPDRAIAALLSDLADGMLQLVRDEAALLKAELREQLSRAGQGAVALVAAGLIGFSGWLALLAAAVLGLAEALPPWLAALIVALAVLAIAALLLWFARNRLGAFSLAPVRTLRSLREDRAWFEERLR